MSETWRDKVGKLLEEAQAVPPEDRAAFLEERCEEEALRREVASLLEACEEASGLFEGLTDAVLVPALGELKKAEEEEEEELRAPDPLDLEGQKVGRYAVEEHLGGGGMGVVYRARDTRLGRMVALKFLPPHLSASPEATRRFAREARAASALDHQHIATIYEIDVAESGRRFIAMAYYEGETLKEKLAREGPLPVEEALGYAEQIAEALAEAHEAGIVHRDVKPANVIVTERGEVKLVDFGLARVVGRSRLTRPGRRLGTAAYMSPEQAEGEEVGPEADLWALGVLLYEMLTAERPFEGERETAILHSVLYDEPVPLRERRDEGPAGLERVVHQCLRKDPADRYSSAEALLEDLQALRSAGEPTLLEAASPSGHGPDFSGRRWFVEGLAALLLALCAAVGWSLLSGDSAGPGDHSPARLGPKSVAVLPFTHLAAEDSTDYFSLGMTDELTTRLAQVEDLSVIGRTSVMRYRGADTPLPEIGKELGVAHLVEGSVQRAGGQVRVQAQLVDAETGAHEWAETYTRPTENILRLQSELAREVTRRLEAELLPRAERQLAGGQAVDSTAYALYLRGRKLRFRETAESLSEAARLLRRSVQVDSTFAPAWAVLSTAAWFGQALGGELPEGVDGDSLARAAARRALTLDSTRAESQIAMGLVRSLLDGNWSAAGPYFQRAVELNPGLVNANREYALYFRRMGQFATAERYLQRAARLDPASPQLMRDLGWNAVLRGNYQEAKHHLRRALTFRSGYPMAHMDLGLAYLEQDSTDAALREMRQAVALDPTPWTLAHLGWAYAQAGRRDSTKRVLERVERMSSGYLVEADAALHAALGNTDRALDLLEQEGVCGCRLAGYPFFDSLRDEPRFQALLEEMGLDEATVQTTMEKLSPEPPDAPSDRSRGASGRGDSPQSPALEVPPRGG